MAHSYPFLCKTRLGSVSSYKRGAHRSALVCFLHPSRGSLPGTQPARPRPTDQGNGSCSFTFLP